MKKYSNTIISLKTIFLTKTQNCFIENEDSQYNINDVLLHIIKERKVNEL